MTTLSTNYVKDSAIQDQMVEAATQKMLDLKMAWVDVCIVSLRLYLTVCSELDTEIPKLVFKHNDAICSIEFNPKVEADGSEFTENDIDKNKQMEMMDALFDVYEAHPDQDDALLLAVCSGRLFMVGYDGLAGTLDKVCFRANKKNYSMTLKQASRVEND